MKETNVSDKKREDPGKKVSKQLRKEGYTPHNTYGATRTDGKPKALVFAAPMSELRKVVYASHVYIINLDIGGENRTAILKKLQFHPVTDALLHVDFYAANDQKSITTGISVKLVGLTRDVRDGGRMNLSIREVNVTAPYQYISKHLSIDVTNLEIGKGIKVGQLGFEELEMTTSRDVVVCSIKMTRTASLSTGEETEEEGKVIIEGEGEGEAASTEA